MKKVLKNFAATVFAAIMLIHNVKAQSAKASLSSNDVPGFSTSAADKAAGEQKDNNALSGIHFRAVKDFQKSFKAVTNEQWLKLHDGYVVTFTADSIQTTIAYNLKGRWNHTVLSYGEKKLPREIRHQVKSVYYDYSILNVKEVYLDDQPIYILYIQDETHLKTISVYDGEMEEIHNYERGDI